MATIQEINSTILFGQFTNDQLNSIVQAVKYARNQLGQKTRCSVRVGSKVSFVGRNGQVLVGSVEKINRKYIIVRTGTFNTWRVPGNMLTIES